MNVLSRRRSDSKPDRGVVEVEYEIENQDRDIVLSMSAKLLVALRDPASG